MGHGFHGYVSHNHRVNSKVNPRKQPFESAHWFNTTWFAGRPYHPHSFPPIRNQFPSPKNRNQTTFLSTPKSTDPVHFTNFTKVFVGMSLCALIFVKVCCRYLSHVWGSQQRSLMGICHRNDLFVSRCFTMGKLESFRVETQPFIPIPHLLHPHQFPPNSRSTSGLAWMRWWFTILIFLHAWAKEPMDSLTQIGEQYYAILWTNQPVVWVDWGWKKASKKYWDVIQKSGRFPWNAP
jgi:hypothetical protein